MWPFKKAPVAGRTSANATYARWLRAGAPQPLADFFAYDEAEQETLAQIGDAYADDIAETSAEALGEIISAQEAERIGIVNRILPVDKVDAFVDDWANRLAAGPPLALAMTKRMLTNSYSTTLSEALDMEGLAQTVNFGSEDTREAILAFLAKRTPEFHGR